MNDQNSPIRVSATEADAQPMSLGRLSKLVLSTLDLEARWYRPPNPDLQTPHDRDKIYAFVMGEE